MFESEAAAVEALANAGVTDAGGEQAAAAAETTSVDSGAGSTENTNTIDLSTFDVSKIEDPQARALVENLRGDYTRKTQEIAPVRKALQEFDLTPDQAREALAFVQALNDPENLQALYQRLSDEFGDGVQTPDDPFGDNGVDPRDQQFQTLQQRIEQMEQRTIRAEVQATLDRQEAQLISQGFKEEELQDVARFALAHGGDLLKGAEDYRTFQQRILGTHLQGKAAVPAGVSSPEGTGHAESAPKFDNLDDAHKAALRAFMEGLNS